jgi:hypothetical protein
MTWEEWITLLTTTPTFENKENPLRFSAPEGEGLYLVGNVNLNPFTKEELYFLKVGQSVNIQNRMKSYRTHNPCLFHIDFCELPRKDMGKYEWKCQAVLYSICQGHVEGTDEWVKVNRDDYLEVCNKGFSYFYDKI